ncbi:MAG: NAD(P)/FAD-dependent oxidoreductase [Deltaproteobacteria bacterium HGW-Deltaproteobacteria-4]|nr:MAG: NAD(P)/FAD-dependent oxidoreductase [Deltaproteobacteria bacterium HGW-Deltaproteobacteria-4]
MESCEVLIVGGGPAGSTCAAKLVAAGLDVLLLDKANFPRVKPCAGWITPAVLTALAIDPAEYGQGRVLQAISGFRTGLINGPEVVTRYDQIVSYGIRRDEFDHYLLQRSGVRQRPGEGVIKIESQESGWLVNGRIKTRLLVGAGGHFCPVARLLGARVGAEAAVVAQVAEAVLNPEQEQHCPVAGDTPALRFCPDLQGYGWLFRKGNVLNVGLGRRDRQDFARHLREFRTFLVARGELPADFTGHFQGHAYCLYNRQTGRQCVGEKALLIGDAAGLAAVHSGEGILPAIESALLAAATIVAAQGDYRYATLESYAARLARHCAGSWPMAPSLPLPARFTQRLGACLLAIPWTTRHLILNRWFLHS